MVVQQHTDKVTERRERKDLGDQLVRPGIAGTEPAPVPVGEPARVWVDEALKDGRLIAGHFEVRYLP
jgi:hypothetical protein